MRVRTARSWFYDMIAVIFVVEPAEGRKQEYLDIAAEMRPKLDGIEGFLSVERFQSLTNPRRILSLSFFEDEAAITRWRNLSAHRGAQIRGRSGVFENYRLRIANVVRDDGMFDRDQAPADSQTVHAK
jgi:heme-degrading monooxygenase HmoA